MTFIALSDYFYGIHPNKEQLPKGWEYIESEEAFLMCKDTRGNLYFTNGKLKARPAAIADEAKFLETGMKIGTIYDNTDPAGGPSITIQ